MTWSQYNSLCILTPSHLQLSTVHWVTPKLSKIARTSYSSPVLRFYHLGLRPVVRPLWRTGELWFLIWNQSIDQPCSKFAVLSWDSPHYWETSTFRCGFTPTAICCRTFRACLLNWEIEQLTDVASDAFRPIVVNGFNTFEKREYQKIGGCESNLLNNCIVALSIGFRIVGILGIQDPMIHVLIVGWCHGYNISPSVGEENLTDMRNASRQGIGRVNDEVDMVGTIRSISREKSLELSNTVISGWEGTP